MHHTDKDFVRTSAEVAPVTEDGFGFDSEIELPTERGHAFAQKVQWPQTEQRFGDSPLRTLQKTDESKYPGVAPNVLQVKLALLPVPHAKCAWQSIHGVPVGTEKHPLAAYVRGSTL